jgi:hypothetical protein
MRKVYLPLLLGSLFLFGLVGMSNGPWHARCGADC